MIIGITFNQIIGIFGAGMLVGVIVPMLIYVALEEKRNKHE